MVNFKQIRKGKKTIQKKVAQTQHSPQLSNHDSILQLQRLIGNKATIAMLQQSSPDTIQRASGDKKGNSGVRNAKEHSKIISQLKNSIKQNNLREAQDYFDMLHLRANYLFKDTMPDLGTAIKTFDPRTKHSLGKRGVLLQLIHHYRSNRKKFDAIIEKYGNVPGAGYEIAFKTRSIRANGVNMVGTFKAERTDDRLRSKT